MSRTKSRQSLEQRVTEFSVRPIRIAYIVRRDTASDTLRTITEYNTSLWGGFYNIFIPTDGVSIRSDWFRLLFIHDPDIIYLVGNIAEELSKNIYETLQPFSLWRWTEDVVASLVDKRIRTEPLPMAVLLKQIQLDEGKIEPHNSLMRYPIIEDGIFALYLHQIFGLWFPSSNYQSYAKDQLGLLDVVLNPTNLRDYLSVLDEASNWLSPIQLTKRKLKITFSLNSLWYGGYTMILSTGAIDDLFIYHILRWSHQNSKGQPTVAIIPISAIEDETSYKDLAEWFASKVGGNTFNIVSLSVDMESLIQFRKNLKIFLPKDWVVNIVRCNFEAAIPTVYHQKRQQIVTISENLYSFNVLKPNFEETVALPSHVTWVCDLDLSSRSGSQRGFAPSMFPDLNFVLSNHSNRNAMHAYGSNIRIARGKFSLNTSLGNDIATIRLPTDKKLISTMCENAEYEVASSGSLYYESIINLLEGVANIEFLHNTHIRQLFLRPDFIRGKAKTIRELYKSGIPHNDKKAFVDLIQALSSKGILIRGYNLKCPICGLETWYELSRIREHMICDGCRLEFQIQPNIDFAYKLNHLFAESKNHGTVTVLLTLFLLQKISNQGLAWQADVKLKKQGNDIEIDIIAMCDGYLILAECKNRFTTSTEDENPELWAKEVDELKTQLQRSIDTAVDLNAQLFLFGTLQTDITQEIRDFLSDQDSKHTNLTVRLINYDELISGKFNIKDLGSTTASMYNLVGDNGIPSYYKADDCSNDDENFLKAVSIWR